MLSFAFAKTVSSVPFATLERPKNAPIPLISTVPSAELCAHVAVAVPSKGAKGAPQPSSAILSQEPSCQVSSPIIL